MAQIENQIFQLINIYAPTDSKDKLYFFKELYKIIEKRNNTLLAGDFNMLEDIFLDKLGGNTSNTYLIGLDIITEIKNQNNLIDIWRKINPHKRLFTYHNPDKTIHTRLDRIYITDNITVKTSTIYPISLSDHDGVTVSFQIRETNPKGPGIWKLNSSILKQKHFQEIFKNYWSYWRKQKQKYENQLLWWDAGKLYLKMIIIEYCTKRNKEINQKQQTLIQNITKEKSKISPNTDIINKHQQDLQDIENYKTTGTIIRSKEKIILNEEKPTKFFYAQEKQKQIKKTIQKLIDKEENVLQTNEEILNECKNFYQNLYTKSKTCQITQNLLLQKVDSKISLEKNQILTKPIEISEIKLAIENMENNKSPGIDGIPAEFYKEFFLLLKKDLQEIFNKVLFTLKTTPKTWNQAIITLIPKQTEKLEELKYWRPISLLCTDYKILAKIFSNRLKKILPHIMSIGQNCSVPQRTIFNNLFLITDLIKYTTEKNNNFYLVQIEQEKAFDKIDRPFLFRSMEKLGLSETFINFIEVLYNQNTSTIINNGFLSENKED